MLERFGTAPRWDTIRSPWDGAPVAEVALGGAAELDAALAASVAGFEVLRRLPTHRRAAILEGTSRRLAERADALATRIARESGKPITFARGEVARAVVTFHLAAGEAERLGGEVVPVDLEPRGEGRLCLTQRVPRGPVAAISPFNFPLNLVAHKLGPAFAAGCSVVLKPPPQCPTTAFVLAELLRDAGLPEGALSVVHCPPDVAQRLAEDERPKVLSFTGSDAVGWRLKALAGKKGVTLELGGNAPVIVDATADLELAVTATTAAAWGSAGQVCVRAQRVLVEVGVFDEFLRRFVDAARATRCGDPLDPATVVGPLIERRHVERLEAWLAEAEARGATRLCGGERFGPASGTQGLTPAVLIHAPDDCRAAKDEVFGPVTLVEAVPDFDQALRRANATRFGLQAGVFTRDVGRALRAFRELDYGGVVVNDGPAFRSDAAPYGGSKDSGLGREGVRSAIAELTEPRTLYVRG